MTQTRENLSLIVYPGGKGQYSGIIRNYFPRGLKEIVSPFFGGGGLEISMSASGVRVFGADSFEPLVNFWNQVLSNPKGLAERIAELCGGFVYREKHRAFIDQYYATEDPFERAALFFITNRSGYSGKSLEKGYSVNAKTLTARTFYRVRNFKHPNLTVELSDCIDTIRKYEGRFIFADPPYPNVNRLYGEEGSHHNDFDHEGFASEIRKYPSWVITYCDTPYIRELYEGFEMIPKKWAYTFAHNPAREERSELIIRNVDEPPLQSELWDL